jgi:hypothetical protein
MRHGFLQIDVFAGLHGVDGHLCVPVVGRGNDGDIDGLVFEQPLVIVVSPGSGGSDLQAGFQVGFVHVTDSRHLHAHFFEIGSEKASASAAADHAGAELAVGA